MALHEGGDRRRQAPYREAMSTASVRYIVDDVYVAIGFYGYSLGFEVVMHPAPTFAILAHGVLRPPPLSAPSERGGPGQVLPDGSRPEPGGALDPRPPPLAPPGHRLHEDLTPHFKRGRRARRRRSPRTRIGCDDGEILELRLNDEQTVEDLA